LQKLLSDSTLSGGSDNSLWPTSDEVRSPLPAPASVDKDQTTISSDDSSLRAISQPLKILDTSNDKGITLDDEEATAIDDGPRSGGQLQQPPKDDGHLIASEAQSTKLIDENVEGIANEKVDKQRHNNGIKIAAGDSKGNGGGNGDRDTASDKTKKGKKGNRRRRGKGRGNGANAAPFDTTGGRRIKRETLLGTPTQIFPVGKRIKEPIFIDLTQDNVSNPHSQRL
jgi:hypothetical protein